VVGNIEFCCHLYNYIVIYVMNSLLYNTVSCVFLFVSWCLIIYDLVCNAVCSSWNVFYLLCVYWVSWSVELAKLAVKIQMWKFYPLCYRWHIIFGRMKCKYRSNNRNSSCSRNVQAVESNYLKKKLSKSHVNHSTVLFSIHMPLSVFFTTSSTICCKLKLSVLL
jgi:hypothetical protein